MIFKRLYNAILHRSGLKPTQQPTSESSDSQATHSEAPKTPPPATAGELRIDRFTLSAQDMAAHAYEILMRYGHAEVDTEHIFLAIVEQTDNTTSDLLAKIDIPIVPMQDKLRELLEAKPDALVADDEEEIQTSITPQVHRLIDRASEESKRLKAEHISDEHFFLALILLHDDSTEKVLRHVGISRDELIHKIEQAR